jgi:hypothetical protein
MHLHNRKEMFSIIENWCYELEEECFDVGWEMSVEDLNKSVNYLQQITDVGDRIR